MSKSLPSQPNLEQLKNQAKDLLKAQKSGDADAVTRFQNNHPRCKNTTSDNVRSSRLTLSDAQLVVAREYGFESWPKLKEQVTSMSERERDPLQPFKQAIERNDVAMLAKLFERHPEVKAKVNEPLGPFDSPVIMMARSREMLDLLLSIGADINAKSSWWAGGFGFLHSHRNPDLVSYAIQRGAIVDVHAAAHLGMFDRLRELISAGPELVHARGGDGQTPLHFASTVQIAEYLLEHGADIDARDIDHESTPAQYMIKDRQDIARYLVRRGCKTDILMAAALGDIDLVGKHLDRDPECLRMRVDHLYFPKSNPHSGGTIYQWTLGWYVSAHDVARQFGHEDVFQFLVQRSPADVKLMAACWAGDETAVGVLLQADPKVARNLSEAYRGHVADAARNNNFAAVRVMLVAGAPVDSRGQHGGTPLHWAAFHGNAEMAREILRYGPPLELQDRDFRSTPLGWAIHGSENGWYCRTGDYPGTVEALIQAGARIPDKIAGTRAVQEVIRRYT